jgi:hypothetical protein
MTRIVPTAPTGGAGTGVVIGADGRVTLTTNTTIKLTCFSSTFTNYRVVVRSTAASAGAGNPLLTYLVDGTATTSGYVGVRDSITGTTSTIGAHASSSHDLGRFDATSGGYLDFTLYGPNLPWKTNLAGTGGDSSFFIHTQGYQGDNTQFTGFQLVFTHNTSVILDIYGICL